MSSRRTCSTAGIFPLLVALSTSAAAPQTRSVSGGVRTADDAPVARTEVRIDGAGANVTTDSGGFAFPLAPPLRVGFPATFRVSGWVVIDPCVLARGRMYLPDPDAETISIRVVRPHDRRLLSSRSLGCVIEEGASRFEPLSPSPRPGQSSLWHERAPAFAEWWRPAASGWSSSSPDSVRVVGVAYHPNAHAEGQRTSAGAASQACSTKVEPQQRQLEQRAFAAINAQRVRMGVPALAWNNKVADQAREHSCRMAKLGFFSHDDPERGSSFERLGRAGIKPSGMAENIYRESGLTPAERSSGLPRLDWRQSLAQQAGQLGFKPKQLASALNRWAKSVTDPYDRGLAALYQQRYAEASRYIAQSIASSAGSRVERYVPLARAEYEQGNYAAAEAALRKVLAIHPGDPMVVEDLAIVSGDRRSGAAADVVGRAVQYWMQHTGHRASILDRAFNQTGVGVVAGAGGSYHVTQIFVTEP